MNLKQLNELIMEKKSRTFANLIKHTESLVISLKEAENLINGGTDKGLIKLIENKIKNYTYYQSVGHTNIKIDNDTVIVITDINIHSKTESSIRINMKLQIRNGKLMQTELKNK